MKNLKKAFICNLVIVVLEIFANLWMLSGVSQGPDTSSLSAARLAMFKFFTVDSNVLMGLIALGLAIEQCLVLTGRKPKMSNISYVMALMGTVGVALTMLVTVFFLAPTMGLIACFAYSNMFLHVINPLASIIAFVCFERKEDLRFYSTFIGIIPMLIYACYYVVVTILHAPNGVIEKDYDWYGFFALGLKSGFFVVPLLVVITYVISICLWKLNTGIRRKK